MHETVCPACGNGQHYLLRDGRRQCVACRRKYTVGNHRGRLSQQTLQLMAQSFWRMVPAATAAAERGMNCKTVQRYYDLLRRAIAEANERCAVERFGATEIDAALFHGIAAERGLGTDARPLFCLARSRERISLLIPVEEPGRGTAPPEMAGWIYAQDRKALRSLDLDRIHCLPASEAKTAFWIFAKKGLVTYHGGFRKNFHLFMREMEFRFNNHDEDATRNVLMAMLQGDI